MYKIIFFGSFQSYSVQILEKLIASGKFEIVGVVTTPPKPAGREQILKETEVQLFSQRKELPVYPLESLDEIPEKLRARPDYLIVAGYGKLIPEKWLSLSKIAPINIHFSLLPDYPGRFPAEWAILLGEGETGVTVMEMSAKFDKGNIVAQRTMEITKNETRETLYKKLYDLGGDLAVETLPKLAEGKIKAKPQDLREKHKYARQLKREDGFIKWGLLVAAVGGEELKSEDRVPLFDEIGQGNDIAGGMVAPLVEKMLRAFKPWPGVWTIVPWQKTEEERLKILAGHLANNKLVVEAVQFEGRKAVVGKDAESLIGELIKDTGKR